MPDEVFSLLARTMPKCPHLKYAVLEQLGNALKTEESWAQFRRDFGRLEGIVKQYQPAPGLPKRLFLPQWPPQLGTAAEDLSLHEQQQLSQILETSLSYEEARQRLHALALAHSDWDIAHWVPPMLETARSIAQKWKK